ncbi:CDGSH iron-sulfur domain-containing protein [Candidatus Woesearchaeota archaeon]|nr:CDGSH iron-sulfur domain-containing protein [Candidatus Woesearchaeota archaeon]
MEEKPIIADKKPIAVDLEIGKEYYYCSCGKSANQPFCDGSHKGTSFTPVPFKAEESKTHYLCRCKHTKNVPFCDGSHNNLE